MARKKTSSNRTAVEWMGGLIELEGFVTGAGAPYHPEALIWMVKGGPIVAITTSRPGEQLERAGALLEDARREPLGLQYPPAVIRTASEELARSLRERGPVDVEIVRAPTPELDGIARELGEHLSAAQEPIRTYLGNDAKPDEVAALFRAAAGLFKAAPWDAFAEGVGALSVTIEALDVHEAVVSVVGAELDNRGFVFFPTLEDFADFIEAGEEMEQGEEPELIPRHMGLTFRRGADVDPEARKEIAAHEWEVASAEAYPDLAVFEEQMTRAQPARHDLAVAEAVALALPALVGDAPLLAAAFDEGEPYSRTIRVATSGGLRDVLVEAPHPGDVIERELLEELVILDEEQRVDDHEARRALEEELLAEFLDAPQGEGFTNADHCELVMSVGAGSFGVTIASFNADILTKILFETFPKSVSVPASEAKAIVAQLRAFFRFLGEIFGHPEASACLAVLGPGVELRLERALGDRRLFGTSKAIVMAGREAGFDVGREEGLKAWLTKLQDTPLPNLGPLTRTGSANGAATRGPLKSTPVTVSKNQKKAQRKAQKSKKR